jgi:rod shape-determining protein MreC
VENLVTRHRSLTVLVAVLFAQVLGLAVQVKRPDDHTVLLRYWAVSLITPVQESVVHSTSWAQGMWHNYLDLRGVRQQNLALRDEIRQLSLERVRMAEDANQAHRLQALLGFKEQFISQTLPAQVISTTGTDFSRGIYIDKGSNDGVKRDMPVITPQGVIGKIYRVYPSSSLVLMINDPTSGAGVILEKSRLQGILKGTPSGETVLENIMSDEKIEIGESVLTSGGDRVFPKGLPIGTVAGVSPGPDVFLRVRVRPAARLDRLEEVLVLTKIDEKEPSMESSAEPVRAADILSQRLPSVPKVSDAKMADPATGMPAPTRNLPPVAPVEGSAAQPAAAVKIAKPHPQSAVPPATAPNAPSGRGANPQTGVAVPPASAAPAPAAAPSPKQARASGQQANPLPEGGIR